MGSERSPEHILDAIRLLDQQQNGELSIIAIAEKSCGLSSPSPRIHLIEVPESIRMDESPLYAIRRKKETSMAVGMKMVRNNEIEAFLSMGNTGALIATARLHLPNLPGIRRPALTAVLPTATGKVAVLDVGANIAFDEEHLVQYVKLGAAFRLAEGLEKVRVGLLNIGTEEEKGTRLVRAAYSILIEKFKNSSKVIFVGNIEGKDVFEGKVDILVTDGFTGNVFLKTCEGVSSFMLSYLGEKATEFEKSGSRALVSHLRETFNYSGHPGALLCGVDGLIIKCHGYSDKAAIISGIKGAVALAESHIVPRMHAILSSIVDSG